MNLFKTLLENRRFKDLKKVIDSFEAFYRAEKGQVTCSVQTVAELSGTQKKAVEASLQARADKGAKLIVTYTTNPQLMGGMAVRMGEQVFDLSVATKVERLS